MIGIYFSGTGNTRFCMEQFLKACEGKAEMYAMEESHSIGKLEESQEIVLGYPTQYSNLPKLVRDFIVTHGELWKGKKVYILATMGLFSGDGAGVAARLLKKYGAEIVGGLHLRMPDSVADVKALKKSDEENRELVQKALVKIKDAADCYKAGNPTQDGLSVLAHLKGLFGQRLYFYNKTKSYTDQLKIDAASCKGCGKCASLCPMHNISMKEGRPYAKDQCTKCYRCINSCPQKAITLIGKKVICQSRIEKYL